MSFLDGWRPPLRRLGLLGRAVRERWGDVWFFPAALVLLAAAALVFIDDVAAPGAAAPIPFAVVPDGAFDARRAEQVTRDLPQQLLSFSTSRIEEPFWFRFSLARPIPRHQVLEFPSRHAQTAQCWTTDDLAQPFASGVRPFVGVQMRPAKAGFAVAVEALGEGDVLCRITFVGPASFSVSAWSSDVLSDASLAYARTSGLLNGGLVTLALFVVFVATLNRERTFLLFAGWLIGNLRLAAISAGWDAEWFGLTIPLGLTFEVRKLTIALYVVLTVALFFSLFRADIEQIGARWSKRFLVAVCAATLLAAVLLPFRWFLPVLWAIAPAAIAAGWSMLLRILRHNPSRMAVCYALSWSFPLLAVLSEVLAAATGIRVSLAMLNNVSGTIVSSMLVALAFAERLRNEREGKTQARRQTRRALDQLHHLVDHDPLTDLPNRRGLEREIEQAIRSATAGSPLSVAYLDLDRFKLINDLFGHQTGDEVLVQVAKRLRRALEPAQMVARVGGDEFVIILRGCPQPQALRRCEQVLAAVVETPIQVGESAFSVAGSLGVMTLDASVDANSVLTACDRACLEAKKAGGRRVLGYSAKDGSFERHLEDVRFAGLLRQRLPIERLAVQMQPIVSLSRPFESLAYEALIRMHAEDGSMVPTGKLIEAAERNGLMPQVDRWMLTGLIDWLEAHPDHAGRVDFASINLSGASLNDERFIADLMSILAAHPRAAARLCFEVTETVALYDLRHTRSIVERIRAFGAKTALDDFGAGYTSFSYLKELPADILKIDGSYVQRLDAQPADFAIVQAITDLGHRLGVRIVAEWAESAETVRLLSTMGVDFVQGWALAKPLPPAQLQAARNAAQFVQDPRVLALLAQDRLARSTRRSAAHC